MISRRDAAAGTRTVPRRRVRPRRRGRTKETRRAPRRYTSILGVDAEKLAAFYGRDVKLAPRETVESECDRIVGTCAERDVALLVVGDALCATTHADVAIRAREAGGKVEVILNASVMGAVGKCGLQLYACVRRAEDGFDAVAAAPRRRDAESPRRRPRREIPAEPSAATPRPRRGYFLEMTRGDAAAATWR